MKIDPWDKLQALKHSTQYRKDYLTWYEESDTVGSIFIIPTTAFDKEQGESVEPHDPRIGLGALVNLPEPSKKLCNKYNLRMPINPNTPPNGYELIDVDLPIKYFAVWELMNDFKEYSWREIVSQKLKTYIGDKLVLMIQRDYPRDQLRQYFETILEMYIKEDTGRLKKSKVDPWEVYEMKEKGLNYSQITRELFNIKGNPSLDPEIEAPYKQVKRAYEKAKAMIKHVENL